MLNNSTVSKYVDAITAEAKQASADIENKIAEYKAEQLGKFRAAAKLQSRSEYARRSAAINQDIGRDFSAKENILRRSIFTKREEIENSVFKAAEEGIAEFTKTPQYKDFLTASAKEIKKNLIGRDKVITVYLRECDMALKDDIEAAFSFPCEFVPDDTIILGGIKARFSKIVLDDTLDSRLHSQISWFEENSGLDIK